MYKKEFIIFISRLALLMLLLSTNVISEEVYKYKDANGRWIFTDKRPLNLSDDEYISVKYKNEKRKLEPRIYVLKKEGRNSLIADNPYHAPVEFLVKSSNVVSGLKTYIVPAASQKILFTKPHKVGKYKYHWRLGDPSASEDDYLYKFPVSSKSFHNITQAFHGKFSHSKQPSMFAVDVALPMRTNISAARSGVVIWVKDDYHLGGKCFCTIEALLLGTINYNKTMRARFR